MWTVKQSATKAKVIATLQFAAHDVPFHAAENFAACY